MKRWLVALAMSAYAARALAGWGVGNGGDSLRLGFAEAKQHAAMVTLKLPVRALDSLADRRVAEWLRQNKVELAADIAKSEHIWTEDEQPTCAWTTRKPAEPIKLSFATCRQSIARFDAAGELLVHESVHHFDIDDEAFADQVALAVYGAWRDGKTDWIKTASAPAAAYLQSAVWTGSELVVFGGLSAGTATSAGWRYDPVKDTWQALAVAGAPLRYGHQAVWTGTQMIVWGGYVQKVSGRVTREVWQNNGAVWDAASDAWQELKTPFGPAELDDLAIRERAVQTLVWTGKEAIVFGGAAQGGELPGGLYDPQLKSWRALAAGNAPQRIYGHTAVWADDRMLVWGGVDQAHYRTNTGAAYDPVTGRWTALADAPQLEAREAQTAVWTGKAMIVFGGFDATTELIGTGGIYDPAANGWQPLKTESVQARLGHAAVWTGSEMLVFGGKAKRLQKSFFNAISAFNPVTKSWRVVDSATAPEARAFTSAVWTGSSLIVSGGLNDRGSALSDGGIFYP